jgi:hypothetical protein
LHKITLLGTELGGFRWAFSIKSHDDDSLFDVGSRTETRFIAGNDQTINLIQNILLSHLTHRSFVTDKGYPIELEEEKRPKCAAIRCYDARIYNLRLG